MKTEDETSKKYLVKLHPKQGAIPIVMNDLDSLDADDFRGEEVLASLRQPQGRLGAGKKVVKKKLSTKKKLRLPRPKKKTKPIDDKSVLVVDAEEDVKGDALDPIVQATSGDLFDPQSANELIKPAEKHGPTERMFVDVNSGKRLNSRIIRTFGSNVASGIPVLDVLLPSQELSERRLFESGDQASYSSFFSLPPKAFSATGKGDQVYRMSLEDMIYETSISGSDPSSEFKQVKNYASKLGSVGDSVIHAFDNC